MSLTTSVDGVADNLLRYHEDEVSRWIETCTDEEFVDICNVADFLLYYGPHPPSGSSMLIDKALAIAAVYVHEGSPRALRRGTRDNKRAVPQRFPLHELEKRRTNTRLQTFGTYGAVGDDFISFWAESPTAAMESRDAHRAAN